MTELPSPPSYSAVRTTTNILKRKGYLRHGRKGQSYLCKPVTPRRQASIEDIARLEKSIRGRRAKRVGS